MNAIDWIALVLMIIGGINWGLVGLAALYGIVLAIRQAAPSSPTHLPSRG